MAIIKTDQIAAGTTAVTASVVVDTGLKNVNAVNITRNGSASPGVDNAVFTYTVSGGTVTIFAWKPTSAANPTLIAGTVACTVAWVATGT